MKTITYAIDKDTGLVFSRVGSEMAIPVLDYDNMKPENNFQIKIDVIEIPYSTYKNLKFTRCIPTKIKNMHRVLFRFPPLPTEK